jgi:hypothetical protein
MFKYLFLIAFVLAAPAAFSQTLWGVDLKDFDAPHNWKLENGLYEKTGAPEGGFDGVLFIPTVGFVFYLDNAEADNLSSVYSYLNEKLGSEKVNKDYIHPAVKEKGPEALTDYIKDGHGFVYREWQPEGYRIRLFWNQYRFWVEAYRV